MDPDQTAPEQSDLANSVDPDQEQSDLGPHCLPICKMCLNSLQEDAAYDNFRCRFSWRFKG